MATNLVAPLDQALAQIYCGLCKSNGTPNVMLIRETYLLRCPLGHQYSSFDEAIARGGEMVRLPVNEQPPPTSIKWAIFVNPKVKELIEKRFHGCVVATLDVLLGSLADGNVLIIAGKDAATLKKRGLSNGLQIISALEVTDNTETENRQLRAKLEQYDKIFRDAGIGG
jgi:hypothetical protein